MSVAACIEAPTVLGLPGVCVPDLRLAPLPCPLFSSLSPGPYSDLSCQLKAQERPENCNGWGCREGLSRGTATQAMLSTNPLLMAHLTTPCVREMKANDRTSERRRDLNFEVTTSDFAKSTICPSKPYKRRRVDVERVSLHAGLDEGLCEWHFLCEDAEKRGPLDLGGPPGRA